MIYFIICTFLIFISFIINGTYSSFSFLYDAKILLPLTAFYVCSVTLSFPFMLVLAFFTGFFWDIINIPLQNLPILAHSSDLSKDIIGNNETKNIIFGYSIMIFGILGTVMQGIKPKYYNRQWILPILFVGLSVFFHQIIEYLIINFLLGGFYFPNEILFRILITSLLSLLLCPVIFYFLLVIAKKTRHVSSFNYIGRRRNIL